jgi:hypothetical protein
LILRNEIGLDALEQAGFPLVIPLTSFNDLVPDE